jgi:hypothetical protein
MAQTKAIARYAVTTLRLPAKGPKKLILGNLPGLGRCPLTQKIANGSGRIKSALLYYREISAPTAGSVVKDL